MFARKSSGSGHLGEGHLGEGHHRNVTRGGYRAAVFGASDGLVSNLAIILGVAGGSSGQGLVRLVGIAGLIAGAVSMAAGEYLSMQAQRELLERELEMERREHTRNPEHEVEELAEIYESRGIDHDTAWEMASNIMADPEKALEVHAREEMGIDPNELGSPVFAAMSSFFAFALGAVLPLLPWFFGGGSGAHRGVHHPRGSRCRSGWRRAGAGHQPVYLAGFAPPVGFRGSGLRPSRLELAPQWGSAYD